MNDDKLTDIGRTVFGLKYDSEGCVLRPELYADRYMKQTEVKVVSSEKIKEQHWRVTLECGHTQHSYSMRDDGPLFVKRCETCGKNQP